MRQPPPEGPSLFIQSLPGSFSELGPLGRELRLDPGAELRLVDWRPWSPGPHGVLVGGSAGIPKNYVAGLVERGWVTSRIGDSVLMLVDEDPAWGALGPLALKGSPVTIHLYVADVDAAVAQAVAAGAKLAMPVTDMFWGDRYGQVEDPFGHKWSVATHTRDLSPQEIQAGMAKMMAG